ncbi:LPS assembly lipoprotein LptE [Lentibacter sp. XHP0401]|jgi:LPS-assembly lipoprotein|uniref:LPS assembly lipoprotein LptE n=1 Tax=Lentibacter sp. XHP0401 TaxID=2984334 RepID=UPI0021E7E195|nr:LPS assembly lipoprotein LptE [Lentibacter sp. XHP0401]MCV2892464.1 LPS assembly lipoprotein LptE [Lentibacter sp. XHP0401]
MWLLDRRAFLLGALALGACGFTPVYGPESDARALLGAIEVDPPRDREGYLLVRHLEERLGRTSNAAYALSVSIELDTERMAITADNVATRYNLLGKATYALRALDGGKVVSSGIVQSFTAYSTTGSTAATRAAEKDATERLMVILGDKIVTRLMAVKLEPAA